MSHKVLITGGRGMVGRNFRDAVPPDWIVAAPSRRELDLTDRKATTRFVADFRPDVIVHAAGRVGGIQANMNAPVAFLLDNIEIGRNVITAASEARIPRLLNLASSCIYPRDREGALRESDILTGPLEPTNEGYAIAKIFALRLCEYLNREQGAIAFKTLVPCNLYGRYDHFDEATSHLVPSVIRKVHQAKLAGSDTVEIWGDGTARREFMYAGDLAAAIVRSIEHFDTLPEVMNVGLGTDHTVLQYYEAAAAIVGFPGHFIFNLDRPVGMRRKLVDVSQQHTWGWQPATTLETGIAATYKYYISEIQ